ncbi:glycoside hydrolase family 2 TIM barrel-domain containing protein [Roseateles sp. P5_E7]
MNGLRCLALAWLLALGAGVAAAAVPPYTEVQMLSGSGPDDAVPWDFTISGGMRAGEAARVPVPSNWQLQGFGHYQYGYDKGPRAADRGVYRHRFTVPAGWQGRHVRIVFDGVMTDTTVKLNGQQVGPVHQGGFNRFSHDITRWLKPGGEANELEVEVSEASANTATDVAERHGDYWAFGGIHRPVWLEASPAESIAHVAIAAEASGALRAEVGLRGSKTVTRVVGQVATLAGQAVGAPFEVAVPAGGAGRVSLQGRIAKPALWTAETPSLYFLDLTLYAGQQPVHLVRERFGFRTLQVRADGLFLNGRRILLKGVNRHSFRPETGRALSRAQAYEDARLIKSMNMNAMRVAHYAPDKAFLEAADELGLYVIDELTGWQKAHDTENGRKLVRELIERDVNHPSILFWANGNEGGWNTELDGEFALHDPRARPVLHPWAPFGGIDTKHYPRYPDLLKRLAGPMPVMPTEFLHGLFDGGAGAGLDDYWQAMRASPRGAGGFLWNLADEGVVRVDQGGRIDLYAAYAPDGLVGPHHEKEPSWFTVRDVWSPVQVDAPRLDARFDGRLALRNAYDFSTLAAVQFRWEWLRFAASDAPGIEPEVLAQGTLPGPAVAAQSTGTLKLPLPKGWQQADALRLTATRGEETLLSWVWPTAAKALPLTARREGAPAVRRTDSAIELTAGPVSARFDAATGLLLALSRAGQPLPLSNGPRLVLARPKDKTEPQRLDPVATADDVYELPAPSLANGARIDLGLVVADGWARFKLEVSPDGRHWTTVFDGGRVVGDGQTYSFPPQPVKALRISGLEGVRQRPTVKSVQLSFEPARFALPERGAVSLQTGSSATQAWLETRNAAGLDSARWTLGDDGRLTLDYAYSLDGAMLHHGIAFDRPSADAPVRALLRGPTPVWQNRLRGPLLGVHVLAQPGYFADPRWLKLGALTVHSSGAPFLQLGFKPEDFPTTTVEFPHADLGFMQAIPAMGAKFQAAELTGPAGAPATAQGRYSGRLVFDY